MLRTRNKKINELQVFEFAIAIDSSESLHSISYFLDCRAF